jgi:excinuclease ABC subunit A
MPPLDPPRSDAIRILGARQNNLKNLDLELPLGELIVVTGVSGSGKSSLVFDTLYAEGQRRYVETFSPYARQFLDRMDKPAVDRIEGIPPAIAIDQNNPVRTSRSTVGTMTELNDHFKLLFARAATLYCRGCGKPVRRDTAAQIAEELAARSQTHGDPRLVLTFPIEIPLNFGEAEILSLLERQGYTRIHERRGRTLQVVQDRFVWSKTDAARRGEAVEAALRQGDGRVDAYPLPDAGEPLPAWRFSTALHCPDCDIRYKDPTPSSFSFNSAVGACESCRGFGRTIGVDYGLVIPNESLSLAQGAIKPWQTESYRECQSDLIRLARKRGIRVDTPWVNMSAAERAWVIDGEGEWKKNVWYGVRRFFAWLETKAYKMHIRVLLSRYRSYTECTACGGARLKPESLLWRIGPGEGLNIRELMLLSLDECERFVAALDLPEPQGEATAVLLREINARLSYLNAVGLGYLNLDRQSRTLSGGEVQRINLTTALGTSLVGTLFVLDEPSIGLHARDVDRIVGIMRKLRDAGNTLVVVEHDPKVMECADRVLDIGPGPGEHGGEVVFYGRPSELARAPRSLTADYLLGRRRVADPDPRPAPAAAGTLRIEGAAEHNLKDIDVGFPLGRLVCVTGVSGSGKSTLVHDILWPSLLRAKGRPTENPGRHRGLMGAELIDDVIMVDQPRLRGSARGAHAQVHGRNVQLQRRHRALCHLRRQRLRARRNAISVGRVPALRRLRWQALSRGSTRDQAHPARLRAHEHCRRPRADGVRSARILCGRCANTHESCTARRSGIGICAARPAGADTFGRRSATPQTRRPTRIAIPVRRADDRPAFRRHRQVAACVPAPRRRRAFAARRRAQSRRDPCGRLDHRLGSRRGSCGRPHRRQRDTARAHARRGLSHRPGTARG